MTDFENHRAKVKTQLLEQDQTGIQAEEEEKYDFMQQSGYLKVTPEKSNGG